MFRFFIATSLAVLTALPLRAADLQTYGMTNEAWDVQSADPSFGCTHRITGTFASGDGDRIAAQLVSSIRAWREDGQYGIPIICLDSPGGSIAEALKLADVLREEAIGTKLEAGARCESACALVFMAGSFFAHESGLYKWRVMHPTAKLGFHAPSLQVRDGQYTADSVTRSYALAMETLARTIEDLMQNRGFEDGEHVKPSLMTAMLRTPPSRMMYVETVDQAGRWGIHVGPLRTGNIRMNEMDFRRACANETAWAEDASGIQTSHYWSETFVEWTSDQWSDSAKVIMNDMSGEGCDYYLPVGSGRTRSALLSQVNSGFLDTLAVFDPSIRLSDLPY